MGRRKQRRPIRLRQQRQTGDFSGLRQLSQSFNEQTTIEFSVRHGQNLSLVVYDLLGRRAQTVFQHSYFAPGSYRAAVGTADWPSGIYSYCLQGSGERRSGRLTCIK